MVSLPVTHGTDVSDSESYSSEISNPKIHLPIIPRMFKNNVILSSLPKTLQQSVIKTVLDMKDNSSVTGFLYFNGGTFAILVVFTYYVTVFPATCQSRQERAKMGAEKRVFSDLKKVLICL